MFKKGEAVYSHDGKKHRVRADGITPKMGRVREERHRIRGFVRGELVDCVTGDVQTGDWHENVITTWGHGAVIRAFAGLQSAGGSTATAYATGAGDIGWARYWAVGRMDAVSSNFSTIALLDNTEYGTGSTGAATASRATLSNGLQSLAATWTLSQTYQYASSAIAHGATINAVGQFHNATVASGTALSWATFASSTKGTTQALNVTYNFLFST